MFKKSLASLISMALFAAGPITAAAQTMIRAAVGGVNATPMIVNSLHSGVQAAPVLNMPTLSQSAMTMSAALAPTALGAALTPAAKITAVAPVADSPLTAIQSAKVADKAPALREFFDNASASDAAPLTTDNLSATDTAFLSEVRQYLRQNTGGIDGAGREKSGFTHRIQLTSNAGKAGIRFEINPPAGSKGLRHIEVTATLNGEVMVDPLSGVLAFDMTGKPVRMEISEAITFVKSELPDWRQWLNTMRGPAMPTRSEVTKGTAGNSGIAGGAIFNAASEFKKKNSARILAIKGVSGVTLGTSDGPVNSAVLLVSLDGTVPQAKVAAAIKKLPGYDDNFLHIKYETMGPIAAQLVKTGPALNVSIKIEVDRIAEGEHGWPAGTLLHSSLDLLKQSGFKIKGKAKKSGNDEYIVYGQMTTDQIKAFNDQDMTGIEITVLKKSGRAGGQNIISDTELNSLFSRWKPGFTAQTANGLNKGPALPSQTVPVIERESLPKSRVLRKKTEGLDSEWQDGQISDGYVGALSGRFKGAPSNIQISVAAKAILMKTFEEYEGRKLENSVAASPLPRKKAVEIAVSNLADGFNADKSNPENLDGLREQVSPLTDLLGKPSEVVAVSAKSTTMDESSDPAVSLNVGLVLFVNQKTGVYVAFYARQAGESVSH